MPSNETAFPFRLQNGEYILEQKHRFMTDNTKISEIPFELLEYLSVIWLKNSGQRFYKGWNECWVQNSRGDQGAGGYPRINVRGRGESSLRRLIAKTYFDLDAVEGVKIYTIMKCGNKDCINPRHMTFADHSNPKLGLD